MPLYSFDVFDTLITRNTATPRGIFALMQECLLSDARFQDVDDYIRRNFFRLRIHAEALAKASYCKNGVEDITLEQIYQALASTGTVSGKELDLLIKLEKDTELANIRGIRSNIRKVLELQEQGHKVILISNMYLDGNTVRSLLHKAEPALDFVPLYVSSECKRIKNTGNLYRYAGQCEQAEFEGWIHTGDNAAVDVEAPGRLGIRTEHYPYEKLLLWEKTLIDRQESNAMVQLAIGASRNARLEFHSTREWTDWSPHQRDAYAIGTSIGGCVLFPYVSFILKESRKKGIHRLYFIARDGYILKKMADHIIEQNQWDDISTAYLYGSREAWRMPAFIGQGISMKELIIWSHPARIKSFAMLAKALGIEEREILMLLQLSAKEGQQPLSASGMYNAVLLLQESDAYWKLIKEKYGEKRVRVCNYLKQEITVDLKNCAFVEVAGSGFTQGCLAELLDAGEERPVQTFYFKLDKIPEITGCRFYNFIPGKMPVPLLIELLTRAPHGQTFDYTGERGVIRPLMRTGEEQALTEYGLEEYIKGVCSFTEEYERITLEKGQNGEDLTILIPYMEAMRNPEFPQLLSFLAEMPDSLTGWEEQPLPFAPRLDAEELERLKNEGWESFVEGYHGSCPEYSLLRLNKEEKAFLGENYRNKKASAQTESKKYTYWQTGRFPMELLAKKVVLYGAGKAGRELYRRIKEETDSRIVLWIDNHWQQCAAADGIEIHPVEALKREDYDQIVLTMLDRELAAALKEELIHLGIVPEKILAVDYRLRWS